MTDAAQVDSTKKTEGATDAPAAKSPVKEIAEKLKNANASTERDIRSLIEKDPAYTRILEMSDPELAELDALLKDTQPGIGGEQSPAQPQPSGTPPQAPQEQAAATPGTAAAPEEELIVKVKPSDLGTYLTGRTTSEAILEAIKGKKNADETIKFFKDKSIPALEKTISSMLSQNQQLKSELEDLKKKQETAPQGAAPAESEKPGTAPVTDKGSLEIPDEIDFYDPESQKKILSLMKGLRDQNSALAGEIKSLKTAPPPTPQQPTQGGIPDEVRSEYEQIRLLQQNPEHQGVFASKSDIEQLERNYVSWVEKLARISGIAGVFDASGRFLPEASNMVMSYMDQNSAAGQQLRMVAEQSGVTPPDDLPALGKIYTVRNIRNQYAKRDPSGVVVPISYEEAAKIAKSMQPELFTTASPRQSIQNAEREAISRGVERRQQFAPEVPAARGAQVDDVSQMQFAEFQRLMKKPRKDYSTQEVETVRKLLKDLAQFSDTEIEDWFKQPGG